MLASRSAEAVDATTLNHLLREALKKEWEEEEKEEEEKEEGAEGFFSSLFNLSRPPLETWTFFYEPFLCGSPCSVSGCPWVDFGYCFS